jgi:competence protein ComEA
VARRRLELLGAELAAIRPDPARPPSPQGWDGSGEPLPRFGEQVPPSGHDGDGRRPGVGRTADAGRGGPPGRHASRSVGAGGLVTGWIEDRLPPSLQGRVRLGAPQLTVVAVLAAAAMALLAWTAVRADDPGDLVAAGARTSPGPAVPLVTPVGVGDEGSAAVPASSPTQDAEVVVDVTGKVRHPGIVRLPVGSRVVDALRAAGGARRNADIGSLNLARVLVDGEQVVVGLPPPAGVAATVLPSASGAGPPAALVNLNTATQPELESLPGIGPVTAQAILQWRSDNGAFSAVDELMEVSGIGEATLTELAPFVTV